VAGRAGSAASRPWCPARLGWQLASLQSPTRSRVPIDRRAAEQPNQFLRLGNVATCNSERMDVGRGTLSKRMRVTCRG
jgi:hypothetical protein